MFLSDRLVRWTLIACFFMDINCTIIIDEIESNEQKGFDWKLIAQVPVNSIVLESQTKTKYRV